jgi:arsenate reductase
VLFVCERNAGRSQMAAAIAHQLARGRVGVRSAGSAPAGEIHPAVLEVMGELGLDLTQAFPKPLTDAVVRAADVVVTMGCGDACPVYAGKQYQDWPVPDPADQPLDAVRQIRVDIYHRVWELLEGLLPVGTLAELNKAERSG